MAVSLRSRDDGHQRAVHRQSLKVPSDLSGQRGELKGDCLGRASDGAHTLESPRVQALKEPTLKNTSRPAIEHPPPPGIEPPSRIPTELSLNRRGGLLRAAELGQSTGDRRARVPTPGHHGLGNHNQDDETGAATKTTSKHHPSCHRIERTQGP